MRRSEIRANQPSFFRLHRIIQYLLQPRFRLCGSNTAVHLSNEAIPEPSPARCPWSMGIKWPTYQRVGTLFVPGYPASHQAKARQLVRSRAARTVSKSHVIAITCEDGGHVCVFCLAEVIFLISGQNFGQHSKQQYWRHQKPRSLDGQRTLIRT